MTVDRRLSETLAKLTKQRYRRFPAARIATSEDVAERFLKTYLTTGGDR